MRVFCTGMVLLAVVGFVSPRVVTSCCAGSLVGQPCCRGDRSIGQEADTGKLTTKAPTDTAPTETARQSCCQGGHSTAPTDRSDSSDPTESNETPSSAPQPGGCQGCGVVCCAKIVIFTRPSPAFAAPAPVDALVPASDAMPSSLALTTLLRPPRSA